MPKMKRMSWKSKNQTKRKLRRILPAPDMSCKSKNQTKRKLRRILPAPDINSISDKTIFVQILTQNYQCPPKDILYNENCEEMNSQNSILKNDHSNAEFCNSNLKDDVISSMFPESKRYSDNCVIENIGNLETELNGNEKNFSSQDVNITNMAPANIAQVNQVENGFLQENIDMEDLPNTPKYVIFRPPKKKNPKIMCINGNSSTLQDPITYKSELQKFFKCKVCDFKTLNKLDIKHHAIKMQHATNMQHTRMKRLNFKCDYCDFRSDRKNKIKIHAKAKHSDSLRLKCEHCSYWTFEKRCLTIHIKHKHLKILKHKCELCDFRAPFKTTIKAHTDVFHPETRRFKCHSCDFITDSSIVMSKHERIEHTNLKKYTCKLCFYETQSEIRIKMHKCIPGHRPEKMIEDNRSIDDSLIEMNDRILASRDDSCLFDENERENFDDSETDSAPETAEMESRERALLGGTTVKIERCSDDEDNSNMEDIRSQSMKLNETYYMELNQRNENELVENETSNDLSSERSKEIDLKICRIMLEHNYYRHFCDVNIFEVKEERIFEEDEPITYTDYCETQENLNVIKTEEIEVSETFLNEQRHLFQQENDLDDPKSAVELEISRQQTTYKCEFCNYSASKERCLTLHKKRKHAESTRFECRYCRSSFFLERHVKKHIDRMHKFQEYK